MKEKAGAFGQKHRQILNQKIFSEKSCLRQNREDCSGCRRNHTFGIHIQFCMTKSLCAIKAKAKKGCKIKGCHLIAVHKTPPAGPKHARAEIVFIVKNIPPF
jgi:hypothetical protein